MFQEIDLDAVLNSSTAMAMDRVAHELREALAQHLLEERLLVLHDAVLQQLEEHALAPPRSRVRAADALHDPAVEKNPQALQDGARNFLHAERAALGALLLARREPGGRGVLVLPQPREDLRLAAGPHGRQLSLGQIGARGRRPASGPARG